MGEYLQVGNLKIEPDNWAQTPQKVKELILALLELASTAQNSANISQSSMNNLISSAICIARKRNSSEKQIVFVCDRPLSRQAKMAYGLKQAGWEVILLHKEEPLFDSTLYMSETHRYENPEQALLLCSLFSPKAYHLFSSWSFETSELILANKPGKVVFDDYDTFAGILKESVFSDINEKNAKLNKEKFCLEKADGLCCRSLALQVAKKNLHYDLTSKTIFFPEYCWSFINSEVGGESKRLTDGLHVAYVGDPMADLFHEKDLCIGAHDRAYILQLTDKKIHYHLHPLLAANTDFNSYMADYIALEKENPYFHLYKPVPCEQLLQILRRYHVGLATVADRVAKQGCTSYLPSGHKYMTNNKTFDYLDAGLKVVIYGSPLMHRLLSPYDVSVYASKEDSVEAIAKLSPGDFDSNFDVRVGRALDSLSVANQARRLTTFYDSL